MIRLENNIEDIFARRFEDVLKMSCRSFEDIFKTSWKRPGKTSWKCLEDVWPRRIYWPWPRCLEDILKTSSEDVRLRRTYSSWSRRLHQDECLLGYLNQQNTPSSIFIKVYLYRSKNPHKIGFERYFITRNAFLAAKLRKDGFRKLFTVRTKSHFSNFELGWPTFAWSRECLSLVFNTQIITGSVKTKKACVSWKM